MPAPSRNSGRLSVCVFCGSRFGSNPGYCELARRLGAEIATASMRLVYGGGDVGLMGVISESCLAAGGEVLGVIPEHLQALEVAKSGLSELIVTATMAERKTAMIDQSDGFIALPGGLGTLDELLEVATLNQLSMIDKPLVLLDENGFWKPYLAFIDSIKNQGFIETTHTTALYMQDVQSALGAIQKAS